MKERIRAIRDKKTQPEFAKSLNVSLGSVQAWEYGLNKPSSAMRKLICATYGVNQNWLETGEGEMYKESASQSLDAITARYNGSKTFRAILDVYARLSAAEQQIVEVYIFKLAAEVNGKPATETTADELARQAQSSAHDHQGSEQAK